MPNDWTRGQPGQTDKPKGFVLSVRPVLSDLSGYVRPVRVFVRVMISK